MNPTYLTSVQKGPPHEKISRLVVYIDLSWNELRSPPPRENLVARGLAALLNKIHQIHKKRNPSKYFQQLQN